MSVLVVGIGQPFRGDDAFGLKAVHLWQEKHPDTARLVRVKVTDTPHLELLDVIKNIQSAILVDAISAGTDPGRLVRLVSNNLSALNLDAKLSHGWGVTEILKLGQIINPALNKVHMVLIGVIGDDFSIKAGLSPQVQASLDSAVEMIEKEVRSLLQLFPGGSNENLELPE